MPDVRDQDTATSPCKLGLYSLDEIPADAPASRPLRDDQFAQVGPEAEVVGTDKAGDRGVVLPHQRQVARRLDTFRQSRVGPITLPESGLRLHQPANGRKILASGFTNHALSPSHVRLTGCRSAAPGAAIPRLSEAIEANVMEDSRTQIVLDSEELGATVANNNCVAVRSLLLVESAYSPFGNENPLGFWIRRVAGGVPALHCNLAEAHGLQHHGKLVSVVPPQPMRPQLGLD